MPGKCSQGNLALPLTNFFEEFDTATFRYEQKKVAVDCRLAPLSTEVLKVLLQ
jgi:hypothetical protein